MNGGFLQLVIAAIVVVFLNMYHEVDLMVKHSVKRTILIECNAKAIEQGPGIDRALAAHYVSGL